MAIRDPLMPEESAEQRRMKKLYAWGAIVGIALVAAVLAFFTGPREAPTITVTVPVEIEYVDEEPLTNTP